MIILIVSDVISKMPFFDKVSIMSGSNATIVADGSVRVIRENHKELLIKEVKEIQSGDCQILIFIH